MNEKGTADMAGSAVGNLAKGAADLRDQADRPMREKTFEELDQAGQIQRLRRELIMARELLNTQQAVIERLMVHQHSKGGEMVVPMHASGRMGSGLAGSRMDWLR